MLVPELMAMAREMENTHCPGQNRGPPLDWAVCMCGVNPMRTTRAVGGLGVRGNAPKKTGIWFPGKGGINAEQAETVVSNSDNRVLLLCKTYWNTHGETLPRARHRFFVFKHLFWSKIALQWCVSFCFITEWISYTYTYIPISPPSCVSLPATLPIPPL